MEKSFLQSPSLFLSGEENVENAPNIMIYYKQFTGDQLARWRAIYYLI